MREQPIEDRLRDMARQWAPPDTLREHVLEAVSPLTRPAVTWSDRLWFSRRWRLAAVGVVAGVLALDVTVARLPSTAPGPRENARQMGVAADQAARQAGLTDREARLFAERAFLQASRPDVESLSIARGSGESK